MYHRLTRLTSFASDGPTGGWLVLQDGEEVQVGPHRLVFELLSKDDSITEALRELEQRSQGEPTHDPKQVSIMEVQFRTGEAGPRAREPEAMEETPPEADSG